MSAAEWGILATASVAIAGYVASYMTATTLARRERLFRVRSETYREVMSALHLRLRAIETHHPLLGQHEPLPEPPSREEMARMNASVGIFGSDEIRKAVAAFGDIVFEFRIEAKKYERAKDKASGEVVTNQFERLRDLRQRARDKALEIERAMQRELAG